MKLRMKQFSCLQDTCPNLNTASAALIFPWEPGCSLKTTVTKSHPFLTQSIMWLISRNTGTWIWCSSWPCRSGLLMCNTTAGPSQICTRGREEIVSLSVLCVSSCGLSLLMTVTRGLTLIIMEPVYYHPNLRQLSFSPQNHFECLFLISCISVHFISSYHSIDISWNQILSQKLLRF